MVCVMQGLSQGLQKASTATGFTSPELPGTQDCCGTNVGLQIQLSCPLLPCSITLPYLPLTFSLLQNDFSHTPTRLSTTWHLHQASPNHAGPKWAHAGTVLTIAGMPYSMFATVCMAVGSGPKTLRQVLLPLRAKVIKPPFLPGVISWKDDYGLELNCS